jgi:hypothetical protein
MSENMYSLQGGYLLWRNNKYLFRVRVELVDLVNQTLVYVLSPILSSAHTAATFLEILNLASTFIISVRVCWLLFAQNTRMHQKNYTMYHHCKKLNPSNHSRYMSNRHVTSPSGGKEFGAAPPERLNYAGPPNRRFSNVSTHSWKWIVSLIREHVI